MARAGRGAGWGDEMSEEGDAVGASEDAGEAADLCGEIVPCRGANTGRGKIARG